MAANGESASANPSKILFTSSLLNFSTSATEGPDTTLEIARITGVAPAPIIAPSLAPSNALLICSIMGRSSSKEAASTKLCTSSSNPSSAPSLSASPVRLFSQPVYLPPNFLSLTFIASFSLASNHCLSFPKTAFPSSLPITLLACFQFIPLFSTAFSNPPKPNFWKADVMKTVDNPAFIAAPIAIECLVSWSISSGNFMYTEVYIFPELRLAQVNG